MPKMEPPGPPAALVSGYRAGALVLDVGMMVVAITFMVLGGYGLVVWALAVPFPLQAPLVPDAALAGLLAGVAFFAWRQGWWLARWAAALPLMALCLYTLWHNALAGGPWQQGSWLSGGPRILSLAAVLLLLWALCCLLGMRRRLCRQVALASAVFMLLTALAGIGWLLLPGSRLGWLSGFVSSPLVAITFALLGGLALLAAALRGAAPALPLGGLSRLAALALLVLSCVGWYVLSANAQQSVARQAHILLSNLELNAQQLMGQHIALLERFAAHSERQAGGERNPEWPMDASLLVERLGYLQGLALVGRDASPQALRAKHDDATLTLLRQLRRPAVRAWLALPGAEARAMPLAAVSPSALLVAVPVGERGRRLVAWVSLGRLLDERLMVELGGLRVTLGLAEPFLTLRAPGLPTLAASAPPMPHLARRHVGLPGGGRLVLDAYVDSPRLLWHAELLPAAFALAGLIVSFLLALSLGFNRLALRHSQTLRLFKRGLDASANGVVIADAAKPDYPLVYVNPAFERISGYAAHEALGRNCRFLQGPETDAAELAQLSQALRQRREVRTLLRNRRRSGELFWNRLSISPMRDARGRCTHFIGVQEDVTLEQEQARRLAYQASHDALTGLPNRAYLVERLNHAVALCAHQGAPLVVLYLDLDDFKPINDALGHEAGNQLLVAVAQRLGERLAASDTLARLASDEFVVLLPGLAEPQQAEAVAEQLLLALAVPFTLAGEQVQISASIGLASSAAEVKQPEELLQVADLAMQEAKRRGRNTWRWFRGGGLGATGEQVALRHELQRALQEDQFALYYQPIVEARSGERQGMEALIRWQHPTRGLVSPDAFIPLAEQTGQIIALGRWVLKRACRDMASLREGPGAPHSVAVNISPLQFRREDFVADVRQALAASGLPPECLELEVTEGVLLSGVEEAVAQLRELRELGVRMAIDDFGTGFSSLSYLRDLPIHKLKLDRAFVQQVLTSRDNAAIVKGVITLAHEMALVVVAEGIETPEQRQALIGYHCDLLQGYLFAKPVPLATLRVLPMTLPAPAGEPTCSGDAGH
ncbi:EAL domain-containing protein [Halomonas sp. H10-9-1]|uniref:putative bifunctional diguanylate cyclase/phosphodiesterase n=1 Tax=Halomonas sp. H10-9-1 TaxID=2950871 RepID=UPI0032DF4CD5